MYTTQKSPTQTILWTNTLSCYSSDFLWTQEYCPSTQHLFLKTVHECNDSKYRLVYKTQQSSFVSTEGVVPTQEYSNRSIFWITTLSGWSLDFLLTPSIVLPTSWSTTCFDEGTRNTRVWEGDRYIHDIELINARTTLDFEREVSSLTSMRN